MRNIELGRVFGIPIRLAPSFLLVLPLLAWLIGSQVGLWVDLFAATVRNVMTPAEGLRTVDPETSVADLLDRMFRERHTGYPVLREGELVGVVTLDDARDVREVERDAYRVADVMTADVRTIGLDADATEALNEMQRHGIGRLPVVDHHGELIGILSRSDLLTALAVIKMGGSPQGASQESILGSMRPPKETFQR